MNLAKLTQDWRNAPTLRECGDDTVERLAARLAKVHAYLMGPDSGVFGYLYQQQVRVNRELKARLA